MRTVLIVGAICMAGVATLFGAAFLFRSNLRNRVDAMIPWVICAQQGNLDRAIRACTIVIDRGEREALVDRESAFYNRGVAYQTKGETLRALTDYTQAITLDPKHANAYVNRGIIFDRGGDPKRAVADFDAAIEINPNDALAVAYRATAEWDLGDTGRSVADFDRALALKPNFAFARFGRGLVLKARGEFDAALADFVAYRKLSPADPDGPKAEAEVQEKLRRLHAGVPVPLMASPDAQAKPGAQR